LFLNSKENMSKEIKIIVNQPIYEYTSGAAMFELKLRGKIYSIKPEKGIVLDLKEFVKDEYKKYIKTLLPKHLSSRYSIAVIHMSSNTILNIPSEREKVNDIFPGVNVNQSNFIKWLHSNLALRGFSKQYIDETKIVLFDVTTKQIVKKEKVYKIPTQDYAHRFTEMEAKKRIAKQLIEAITQQNVPPIDISMYPIKIWVDLYDFDDEINWDLQNRLSRWIKVIPDVLQGYPDKFKRPRTKVILDNDDKRTLPSLISGSFIPITEETHRRLEIIIRQDPRYISEFYTYNIKPCKAVIRCIELAKTKQEEELNNMEYTLFSNNLLHK
jgi:hypothetical protein